MRLGGKVDHRTRLIAQQQASHQRRVAKVTVHKHMARIA